MIGRTAAVTLTVDESDTAVALGSGEVRVLATPRVVALAEEASVAAIADELEPEQTSVGVYVELRHRVPSPVGADVVARSTVTGVEGRKVSFSFEVLQASEVVAVGTHERVIVDRNRFPG